MDIAASLHLLPKVWSQIGQSKTPAGFAVFGAGAFAVVSAGSHRFQRHGYVFAVPISHDLQMDCRAWLLLSDSHLKLASIAHGLAIEPADDITDLQSCLGCR